jgi:hypothetical protein
MRVRAVIVLGLERNLVHSFDAAIKVCYDATVL